MEHRPFAISPAWVAASVLVMTLAGFFVFPGHTWLGSDTQIYAPMLERLYDPGMLARDLVTTRLHLGWTAFDEIAIVLRRATSLSFEHVLLLQQLVFRALALWGLYLIAQSLELSRWLAVMAAGLVSLGAAIPGPAVFTVEYEPVPRGFALALLLLAIGLTLRGRPYWAAAAGSLALLYHPPTTIPFWLVFAWLLWTERRWRPLLAPAVAAAVLMVLWRWQSAGTAPQALFGGIHPEWRAILRLRASYIWISLWPLRVFAEYGLLALLAAGAALRLGKQLDARQRAFCLGLPAIGLVSIAVSWTLLEGLGWRVAPELQPARNVLWITLFAVFLSAVAGIAAARERRHVEAFGWMLAVFLLPVRADFLTPLGWRRAVWIAVLAAASVAAVRIGSMAAPAMVLIAMFAIPYGAQIHNYPDLRTPALEQLCAWGATAPKSAVFLFPDAGHNLYPGVFRAEARRAVYVDWKAGGQANFFESLALEWWRRWRTAMTGHADLALARLLGVDYVIVSPEHALAGVDAAYRNAEFVVYRAR